jgi:spore germination cell wall hydrolase CwlJ-like protein
MQISNRVLAVATGTAVFVMLSLQQRQLDVMHRDVEEIKSFLVQSNEQVNYTASDMNCLAENIYYEAGIEPVEGKYAVAQVTLNRVKNGYWGKSICKVVHSKAQFSWTLKKKRKAPKGELWRESQAVARNVLAKGIRVQSLQHSLMYHADYVKPKWADRTQYITKVGQHIFYRRGLGSTLEI